MSVLEIKNLSHIYDSKQIFDRASMTVNGGEHIGVVGLNGAGKSTFINIIAGKIVQDEGEVLWQNGIRVGYLDQHADIDRSLTVMEYLRTSFSHLYELNEKMENLYAAMGDATDQAELDRMIDKANRFLERLTDEGFFDLDSTIKKVAGGLGLSVVGYDTLIAHLSGGQRAKLMLCKLLLSKPDLMLLDEPTNFLDAEHVDWLCEFLNSFKGTFLVISHDSEFLDRVCKFVIGIENGSMRKTGGNYTQYLKLREQLSRQYEDDYKRQQQQIEKMEEYIARNKARAATAGMANARKKQLDKLEILKKPITVYDAEFTFPYVELHTKEIIKVKDLSIGYDSPLLPPFSFTLSSEERLWIRGTNGIGKTTLLKTLAGKLPALGGSYVFHPFAAIGYLEQEPEFISTEISAVQYFSDLFPRLEQKAVRAALAKSGIIGDLAVKPVKELSGGEQVRILLTVMCARKSNILLLDEPTNHLDVRAKNALKEGLKSYAGALILVTHEREFADGLCERVMDIKLS